MSVTGLTARALATALALALLAAGAAAQPLADPRVRSAVRVFRAVLGGDQDIAAKATRDGRLVVLALTSSPGGATRELAEQVVAAWGGPGTAMLKELRLEVRALAADAVDGVTPPVAGVMLAEPMADGTLERLIAFAARHKVVLYSPFEGDVERGVPCGCVIEAKVLPHFNMRALRASGVRMREMFLKVGKLHE